MSIFKKLFGKDYKQNLYANVHRWMNGERQLEMHRIATNKAVPKKDRIQQLVTYIDTHASKSHFMLYGGDRVNMKDFATYIFNMKNN